MPDWTYHPFFKPLLFGLPAELSRRLTLGALTAQSKTAPGRWLFKQFSPAPPKAAAAVTVFGLEFPSVVGLGPGIATHGEALEFLKDHFGFGFLELGPVAAKIQPDQSQYHPLRLVDQLAIARSELAHAPSSLELAQTVKTARGKRIPVGFCLRGDDLCEALKTAEADVDFFTLPQECLHNLELSQKLRAATHKPILVRLAPTSSLKALDEILDLAIAAGFNGCLAITGAPCEQLPLGQIEGPFLKAQALQTVQHIHQRLGAAFPIIGSGGITTPQDALDFLAAGASLVEIASGFVYAGPGLPMRIIAARQKGVATKSPKISEPAIATKPVIPETLTAKIGWRLLAFSGAILIFSGLAAFILAATIQLLPPDTRYLGMSVAQLCSQNACRIVHFMAHDRVSFGGSILAIGTIYVWLASVPLRRGEAWAWWTLALSGFLGFLSFLTYLGYGYLDYWHGLATLALIPVFCLGLFLSWPTLRDKRSIKSLFHCGAQAWLWSPANIGRLALSFCAFGMVSGGLVIMLVGMTHVFVPQDLQYMRVTVAELTALNPRLISLIAHDRAGFGGGLCSCGIAIFFTVWCGARPGERGLWWTFLWAGLVGFGTAVGVHPVIGYVSFIHLLPAYLGSLGFGYGMVHLYRPLCLAKAESGDFSDV